MEIQAFQAAELSISLPRVPRNVIPVTHHHPKSMSADFWAGYLSGAAGILLGNPLDLIKVRLQAEPTAAIATVSSTSTPPVGIYSNHFTSASSLIRGVTAPILGYGALNALLFVTYNRTSSFLTTGHFSPLDPSSGSGVPTLWTTWLAGAIGGLATCVVSTPTELIKCRAQMSLERVSSWGIAKQVVKAEGLKGLYVGGVVTALRDGIGYGFYFWSYEFGMRTMASRAGNGSNGEGGAYGEAAKVLLCGGVAGVITWASVFPLDVVKTRVQTQLLYSNMPPLSPSVSRETGPLLGPQLAGLVQGGSKSESRLGAIETARRAYRVEGSRVFFRGLLVCSVRAFLVNAVQWAVYEWIMRELQAPRPDATADGP